MRRPRRPRVIPHWRRFLRYAWSVRLILIAGFLAGLQSILPLLADVVPPRWLAPLTFLTVMAALVAQFIVQQKISGDDP